MPKGMERDTLDFRRRANSLKHTGRANETAFPIACRENPATGFELGLSQQMRRGGFANRAQLRPRFGIGKTYALALPVNPVPGQIENFLTSAASQSQSRYRCQGGFILAVLRSHSHRVAEFYNFFVRQEACALSDGVLLDTAGNVTCHQTLSARVFENSAHHADGAGGNAPSPTGCSAASLPFYRLGRFSCRHVALKVFNISQLEGFSLSGAE